jgi:L-ascorbate metabolism protein UlaG (beta-lactamase superfamily)
MEKRLRNATVHAMTDQFYLRPNVVVEPLVHHWYAWSQLIPPATAARNTTERHMRIMDSFIQSPEAHVAAVKNPKMLGGPFMDLPVERVDDIKRLAIETSSTPLAELSRAICELDGMLHAQATGYSLEPLYEQVPEPLQGYVELVYDLHNNPSFRLVEPLLYKSHYYDPNLQTLMLSLITGDDRPFVLSTPRFQGPGNVHLRIPFANEQTDRLFQLKNQPATFTQIKDMLDLPDEDEEVFHSFLTVNPTRSYQRYEGKGARWRYFGHACILLEANGSSLLTDPVLSYTYENNISRYTYEDLPDVIDCVLITHNHQDHLLFETLLQLRSRIRTIVVPRNAGGSLQDPSMKLILKNCGFKNVVEMEEMDELQFGPLAITAIPFLGEHGDLDIRTKMAYLTRVDGHSLLFAADSCNISPQMYKHIHADIGDVDVVFLGMECDGAPMSWLYGPLLTEKMARSQDQSRRLAGSNFERANHIVEQFRCKELYVYAMGQEPWLNYVMSVKYTEQSNPIIQSNKLIETCRNRGITAERLFGEKEFLLS